MPSETSNARIPEPAVGPDGAGGAARGVTPAIGLVVSILVLGTSVSIMSTDMYAPSLPDLVTWFDTAPTRVGTGRIKGLLSWT